MLLRDSLRSGCVSAGHACTLSLNLICCWQSNERFDARYDVVLACRVCVVCIKRLRHSILQLTSSYVMEEFQLYRSTWHMGIFAACMIAAAAVLSRIAISGTIAAAAPNESKPCADLRVLCRFLQQHTNNNTTTTTTTRQQQQTTTTKNKVHE
jgi:hypothetical protein